VVPGRLPWLHTDDPDSQFNRTDLHVLRQWLALL